MKQGVIIRKLIIVFFVIPTVLFASGRLKGTVVDSLSQDGLIGANVILVGTSLGSATDIEGDYEVYSIPPGEYTVRCTYIGYVGKEVSVTIIEDQTTLVDFQLVVDVIEGNEVVVSAQALGQAAAINQQVSSNTIVNVVSEQKIKELPDANAAEALGRLPGVSILRSGGEANKITLRGLSQNMTTITVDGIKLSPTDADARGIDLSTISQGSLSGIVLSKAITSDMEAEAIAGNVNFVTKNAPEEREVQVNAYGSYSSMDNTAKQYNFVGRYGERFFNNVLGVQLFGNFERRSRSSEEFDLEYDQTLLNKTDYEISNFVLTYTPEIRKRGGVKVLLDYRLPNDGILKLNTEYNRTERRLSIIDRNYAIDGGDITYNFRGQDINTDIKNISLQGENHISNWQVNWNMSYSESSSETPYDQDLSFNEPSTTEDGVVISGMNVVPEALRKTTSYEELIPYALNNFDVAYFYGIDARTSKNLDFEKTLFLDAKRTYNLLGFTGELKFGSKYRSKYHRRSQQLNYSSYYNANGFYDYVKLPDGTIEPKDFEGYGYGDLQMSSGNLILLTNFIGSSTRDIFDKYLLTPMIEEDRVRDWYEMNKYGYDPDSGLKEFRPSHSQDGTNYNLTESVTSGYIMNTLNIGTMFTFISGVRIERDDNTYNALYANSVVNEWSVFNDTSATHSETAVLPNFHLIVKPADYMSVRLAAYKGLTRPNFNYRLPTYIYGTSYVVMGNPGLKNAKAWNFEVNVQLYSNTIGLFSVSAFYKKITDEVHLFDEVPMLDQATGDSLVYPNVLPTMSSSYDLTYPYNSDKPTRVWGFEVEHQTNFRYLPGLLSNIVLSYNVSFIKTETYTPAQEYVTTSVTVPGLPFPTTRTTVRLYETLTRTENSPELFGNVSLGYDIGGFSARLSYFYQGEYYNGFSGDGYDDNIQKAFGRVDLSLKQNISKNLDLGLNVNNLTDAEEGTYLENKTTGWKLETSSYKYGTTADLWLRVSM